MAPGGGPRPPAESVTLAFAWPEEFRAELLVRHESQQNAQPPVQAFARRTLSAARRDGELWISTYDDRPGRTPEAGRAVRGSDALVQVVTPQGAFLRAELTDRALRLLESADRARREEMRRALVRAAAEDWEITVGAWAGRRLERDRPLHKTFQGSVPLLPIVQSLLDVEYVFDGRVPCAPDETERRCVALVYRGETASSDEAATLERIRSLAPVTTDEPVTEAFHGGFSITLVTEPDTLVPHRMVSRERLRLRVALPDGQVREVEETAEDEYVFKRMTAPERGPTGST